MATPHSSLVKGKWTESWRHQQPTDKSSFIQPQTGRNTHSEAPWEFVAASVSSRMVLATLSTIPIGTVIYLTDNYWMTFENEVNVCTLSFLTTRLVSHLISIFLRQMKNKIYLTLSQFCFSTEWSWSCLNDGSTIFQLARSHYPSQPFLTKFNYIIQSQVGQLLRPSQLHSHSFKFTSPTILFVLLCWLNIYKKDFVPSQVNITWLKVWFKAKLYC